MLKEAQLQKLPYYAHLTQEQKQMISDRWQIQTYKKGEIIHGCAEECLGQILMLKGSARTYILSEEGREITLFVLRPDDTCVLSASCVISQITFETQMVAEEDCEMLVLNSGVFFKLTEENIYVKCYMYELLTKRFSSVMWVMQEILFKGFDRRLAGFLIGEYERTGNPEIKMTHEQIAQHTNSVREVVARMLKRFSYDHLLNYKRGVITLTDIDGLYRLK